MNKIEVRLSCRHVIRTTIESAREHDGYCRFHGWQRITVVFTEEWHVFCADCRYSRWYGQKQSGARQAAERHGINNPMHRTYVAWSVVPAKGPDPTVKIIRDELALAAQSWENDTTNIDDDTDVIPF